MDWTTDEELPHRPSIVNIVHFEECFDVAENRGVNRPKFEILNIFAGGQGGRTGPLAGPGQRPGGGPGVEAPGSSWTLRKIKAQYAIS